MDYRNLFDRFKKGVIEKSILPNVFSSKYGGIGEKVIDSGIAEYVYGTPEKFIDSYKDFEKYYFELISDPINLKKSYSSNLDIGLRRKAGIIDLSILNFQARQEAEKRFRSGVLQIERLTSNVGFGNIMFPTANPFSAPVKFEVDQNLTHPAQVMLNRMIFNMDPTKTSLSSMKFGGQLASAEDIERNLYQIQQMRQGNLLREGSRIVTLDVETTGILPGSQLRSVALAERTTLLGPSSVVQKFGYEAPQMGGLLAGSDLSETLSSFIARQEDLGGLVRNEDDFLKNIKSVLLRLNEADQVTGHNVRFDINQIIKAVSGMPGYAKDAELQEQVTKFLDRISTDKNFLIDTLEIGRSYITDIAQRQMSTVVDPLERGQRYMQRFFSNDSLADVMMGGKSTYVGVENFVMNTNLLDLIAEEQYAPRIFERIFRGSHIAETDTILQDHILKYIHNKTLTFRDMHSIGDRKVTQETIDVARRTVFKSAATTAVTNIADPRYLSQTALDYVLGDEGIKGVRAMISESDARAMLQGSIPSSDIGEGYIKYDSGRYRFFSGNLQDGPLDVDQARAAQYLRAQVQQAQQQTGMVNIPGIGAYNPAEKRIVSLGVNFAQSADMEIMARTSKIAASALNPLEYVNNVGLLYQLFGNQPTLGQEISILRGKQSSDQITDLYMNFSLGVNSANNTAQEVIAKKMAYASAMLGSGNKYGFLGDTSAILSAGLSQGTQDLAAQMVSRVSTGDLVDEQLVKEITSKLSYAVNPNISDITSQFGTSIFEKQTGLRMFSQSGDVSKLLLSYDYFKTLTSQTGDSTMADLLANKQVSVSLSLAQSTNQITNSPEEYLNIVWKSGRDGSQITSMDIASRLYDDMMEADAMKNMNTKTKSEVAEQVAIFQTKYKNISREDAIAQIAEGIDERGIVIGQYRGSGVSRIKSLFERMGLDLASDSYNSMSMNILDEIDDKLITGAMYDPKTVAGSQAQEMLRLANESAVSDRAAVSEALSADDDLLRQAQRQIKSGRRKSEISSAVDMYNQYKGKVGIAALGLTALVGGYYMYKNYKENQLYNETLQQQPYENGRQVDYSNNYTSNIAQQPSYRRDPLVTAGVVGNLDRRKIGHTQMGNNKYNHLYTV